jgi:hypothetical protein
MVEAANQAGDWSRIEPHQLAKVSVVAQCLDNQWVPKSMLDRMLANSLSLEDVQTQRSRRCHAEYMRALVNARQVVVNRAFFYNNPVVFHRYLGDEGQLAAIRTLLGDRTLVPFFFQETSPVDPVSFSTDARIVEGWRQLCLETPMTCVRLSWDDRRNRELADNQLARRFLQFTLTAVQLTQMEGCPERLARDLRLRQSAIPGLEDRLRDIAQANLDGKIRSREDLYRSFVVADSTPVSQGCYDRSKPFAGEIKQLFDLQYNVSMPDALVRLPLTPQDSLGRSALQELERGNLRQVSAADLVRLIRGRIFEVAQSDLSVPAFENVRPSDVVRIRQSGEWADYATRLESLLTIELDFTQPESIGAGIQEVSAAYGRLAAVITRTVERRDSRARTFRWQPVVRFVVKAAGAILFVHFVAGAVVLESLGEIATTTAAELVLEVVIGRAESLRRGTAPTTSYELFRGLLEDPRNQWAELLRSLNEVAAATSAPRAPVQPSSIGHPA